MKKELARQLLLNMKQRRKAEMTTKQGKLKADRKARPQKIFLDDLASLENLTIVGRPTHTIRFHNHLQRFSFQESMVDQLEQRYVNGVIYTYIGDILVSLNPFSDPGIYTEKVGQISAKYLLTWNQFFAILRRKWTCTGIERDPTTLPTYSPWRTPLTMPCSTNGSPSASSSAERAGRVSPLTF